jgi:hypothetical protein
MACGLHQLVFHPLFILPFLVWMWAGGKRRSALLYLAGLVLSGLFWVNYWPIATAIAVPYAPEAEALGRDMFLSRVTEAVLMALQPEAIIYMAGNLLRFATWQNPLTLVLLAACLATFRSQTGIVRSLLGGIALILFVLLCVMPFQGHGWGYRYLHGYLGSFALLGAYGWNTVRERLSASADLHRAAIVCGVVSVFILLPLRTTQAAAFAAPYRNADALLSRLDAEAVIIDPVGKWYAIDLVRNDPGLRNRPIRLAAEKLTKAQVGAICGGLRTVVVNRFSPELRELSPSPSTGSPAAADQRMRWFREAGCEVSKRSNFADGHVVAKPLAWLLFRPARQGG